jgi:hypothetical protein
MVAAMRSPTEESDAVGKTHYPTVAHGGLSQVLRIRYDGRVRRTSAILLLAFFSFSLVSAAFGPDAGTNLPECCRRAGQHHCAIAKSGGDSQPGASVKAKATCRMYPAIVLYRGGIPLATVSPAYAVSPPNCVRSLKPHRNETHVTLNRARVRHERGPPHLFS